MRSTFAPFMTADIPDELAPALIGMLIVLAITVLGMFLIIALRFKKCPSDKIMVIYGKLSPDKDGNPRHAICIHGGAAFIWPLIQAYEFLDLTPLSIPIDLKKAHALNNVRVHMEARFCVGISTEPGVMQNAAERLLGLKLVEIQELAMDIIFGQLRLVIASMDIEEIEMVHDKFLETICEKVEAEIKKVGLRLININIMDVEPLPPRN